MTPARLIEWREHRGWSAAKAASACGVSANAWRAWETGSPRIPAWLGYVLRAVGDCQQPYQ